MTRDALWDAPDLIDEFDRLYQDLAARDPVPRHMVVLGAAGREGVSLVADHLALAVARVRADARILLVDAGPPAESVADVATAQVTGSWDWDPAASLPVRAWDRAKSIDRLGPFALPRGADGGSHSERLSAAFQRARQDYNHSIWDLPPVLTHADSLNLATVSDGALVVVEMDETRVGALHYLRSALSRRHVTVLGAVLNRCGRYWPRAASRRPL